MKYGNQNYKETKPNGKLKVYAYPEFNDGDYNYKFYGLLGERLSIDILF